MGNSRDAAWYKKYEELKQFRSSEGHCNVPQCYSENKSLGHWVKTQRQQYKFMKQGKASIMSDPRIRALEEIGFKWSAAVDDVAWYEKYEELKQFRSREGHCNVPQRYSKNKSLGLWVNAQRKKYNHMKQGKKSNITEPRIRALEEIGFKWIVNEDASWCKKYDDLKQFKRREGHCNVPACYIENKSLGYWVSRQRLQYKYMRQGKISNMTKSRIRALEDIGFEWSVNDDVTWSKKYDDLKQFMCREGHCDVPESYSEEKSLGYWVNVQRKQYKYMRQGKTSNMTEARIQALEAIGFKWSANNPDKVVSLK